MKILIVLAVVFALVALLKLASTKKEKTQAGKFKVRGSILTPAEELFHNTLVLAAKDFAIFPKLRVADVIQADTNARADFFRISQKHFDWIICDPQSLKPIAAIELDDASHKKDRAKYADGVKDAAAASAGLPLIRITCRSSYDQTVVRKQLLVAIEGQKPM